MKLFVCKSEMKTYFNYENKMNTSKDIILWNIWLFSFAESTVKVFWYFSIANTLEENKVK